MLNSTLTQRFDDDGDEGNREIILAIEANAIHTNAWFMFIEQIDSMCATDV